MHLVLIFIYRSTTIPSSEFGRSYISNKASSKSIQTITQNAIRGSILIEMAYSCNRLINKELILTHRLVQDEYIALLAEALSLPTMN
jgi:hypothetical protein